ncbi:hypothetical protein BDR07DRAFT_629034 [Suillus spraguei]|nr:hypothetical protein BDR07DRAFT_629034 [Suillus spraguei]
MYPFSNQGHNAPSVDPRIAASNFTPTNAQQHERHEPQPATTAHAHAANAEFRREHEYSEPHEPATGVCDATTATATGDAPGWSVPRWLTHVRPTNDTFPTLRSNSTIPGIARSGRSPSESVHSPMTPRAQSRLSSQLLCRVKISRGQ